MAEPLNRTPEGWEHQFATNHLGHFGLALGLHDALAAAGDARIVSVSSSAHLRSDVHLDDLHFEHRPYEEWAAYGQSKTANILFAVEAAKRWAPDGIVANALMPGGIDTPLQRHLPPEFMERIKQQAASGDPHAMRLKSTEQGAATTVLLAASPLVDGVAGRYYEDCQEAPVVQRRPEGAGGGVAPYALDPDNAARLWEVSERLVAAP
jgi:NAD(P)-dependent dehydrogenase (short-subunit alcohol dehydrogenase family)